MSSRKPGYLIGVMLLSLVLSAPQLFIGFQFAVHVYQFRGWMLPSLPGFGSAYQYQNQLNSVTFWQDKFIDISFQSYNSATTQFDWKFYAIDPETGEHSSPDISLSGISGFQEMSFGDRLTDTYAAMMDERPLFGGVQTHRHNCFFTGPV